MDAKRFIFFMMVIVMAITSLNCEDNMLQKRPGPIGDKTTGTDDGIGPDDKATEDGGYPYPEIIEKEFIPRDKSFAHTKCYAWRITWPAYDDDADQDLIPTVFSTANGELNSFNFLNNSAPSNTYNGDFSLYNGDKVEAANTLLSELEYVADGFDQMTAICFAENKITLDFIMEWVTSRPSLFEVYWPGTCDDEIEYDDGDFIQFTTNDDGIMRYGGIRIVSMTPRIIEVYLAVPNL